MKPILYITAIIFFSAFVIGCKKKNQEYTITGRMMFNCETPAPNTEFKIKQFAPLLGNKDYVISQFETDQDGYFEFIYKNKEATSSEFVILKSGEIVGGIPPFKDIDLGEVVMVSRVISFVRRLEVTNGYTENDTLYLPNYYNLADPNDNVIIAGPFESEIIDTVWNWDILTSEMYNRPILFYTSYSTTYSNSSETVKVEIHDYCKNLYNLYDVPLKIE